jgi:hypothetical protein
VDEWPAAAGAMMHCDARRTGARTGRLRRARAWEQISPLLRCPNGSPTWLALRDIDLNAKWPAVEDVGTREKPRIGRIPGYAARLAEVRARLVLPPFVWQRTRGGRAGGVPAFAPKPRPGNLVGGKLCSSSRAAARGA